MKAGLAPRSLARKVYLSLHKVELVPASRPVDDRTTSSVSSVYYRGLATAFLYFNNRNGALYYFDAENGRVYERN